MNASFVLTACDREVSEGGVAMEAKDVSGIDLCAVRGELNVPSKGFQCRAGQAGDGLVCNGL